MRWIVILICILSACTHKRIDWERDKLYQSIMKIQPTSGFSDGEFDSYLTRSEIEYQGYRNRRMYQSGF